MARSQPELLSPPASLHPSLLRSKIVCFVSFFFFFKCQSAFRQNCWSREQSAWLTGCPEPVGQRAGEPWHSWAVCCAGEDSKPTA